jgi:hypothetical protein
MMAVILLALKRAICQKLGEALIAARQPVLVPAIFLVVARRYEQVRLRGAKVLVAAG